MAGRICQITRKRNESKATMESLMPVSTMNPVEEIFSRKLLSHFAVRKAFTLHWRMVHPKIYNDMDLFFRKKKSVRPSPDFFTKKLLPVNHQPTRHFQGLLRQWIINAEENKRICVKIF